MQKAYFRFALLFGLVAAFMYLGYGILHKLSTKKAIAERVAQLPAFQFVDLAGRAFTQQDLANKPTWLLYFDSTCEFCQMEISDLEHHQDKLREVQLVLISAESKEVLEKFSRKYSFTQHPNVKVVQDTSHHCQERLGLLSTPSSLVYDASGHLIKKVNGVMKTEKIIELIQPSVTP